tara:strand:+ start:3972 stop:4556 length:585 start_codon:yes stop_codon:yes gene_type:complete
VALFNKAARQSIGNNGTGYVKVGLGETLCLKIKDVHEPEQASNANGSWEVVPIDAYVVSKKDANGAVTVIEEDRRWSPASKNLPKLIELDDRLAAEGKSMKDVVIEVTCKGIKNPHTGNTYHTYVCRVAPGQGESDGANDVDHVAALEAAQSEGDLREAFASAWKSTADESVRGHYKAVYDARKAQFADGDLPF